MVDRRARTTRPPAAKLREETRVPRHLQCRRIPRSMGPERATVRTRSASSQPPEQKWQSEAPPLLLGQIRWLRHCWRSVAALCSLVMSEVTRILSAIEQGDPSAAEQLLPLVYDELRKLAARRLAQEKPGQTLQATALVHEAYLRLVGAEQAQRWGSPRHF